MRRNRFLYIQLTGILLIFLFLGILPNRAETSPQDNDSLKILFFGDSMTGALNKRIRQYAHHNAFQLLNVVWYSSTTKLWAETDTLFYYLKSYNPNYVLICLGANELSVHDLDNRKLYIRSILQKIGNRPYIWISPPNWKKDTGINRLIEEQTGRWRYYPSWKLSFERKEDGAHPTPTSSSQWMDSIAKWIMHESCYPIPMFCPNRNAPQTGKVILLSPTK